MDEDEIIVKLELPLVTVRDVCKILFAVGDAGINGRVCGFAIPKDEGEYLKLVCELLAAQAAPYVPDEIKNDIDTPIGHA